MLPFTVSLTIRLNPVKSASDCSTVRTSRFCTLRDMGSPTYCERLTDDGAACPAASIDCEFSALHSASTQTGEILFMVFIR
ncbi:Uncharacterised protein [Pseudomonas fragi]|uniref:Uncharacterized protein n=1 Tax=Pseudomonas fragi TaxID=296 RepID=A0A449IF46_PSEFR|nr:Uncharacterised protein [Pseudomonas fragi]